MSDSFSATVSVTASESPSVSCLNCTRPQVNVVYLGSIRFPTELFIWLVIACFVLYAYLVLASRWFATILSSLINRLYFRGTAGK
jgi:hypothetical protein